jgi:hypothetical protein
LLGGSEGGGAVWGGADWVDTIGGDAGWTALGKLVMLSPGLNRGGEMLAWFA